MALRFECSDCDAYEHLESDIKECWDAETLKRFQAAQFTKVHEYTNELRGHVGGGMHGRCGYERVTCWYAKKESIWVVVKRIRDCDGSAESIDVFFNRDELRADEPRLFKRLGLLS